MSKFAIVTEPASFNVPCFQPAWWLPSGHLQTWSVELRRPSITCLPEEEEVELRDGQILYQQWCGNPDSETLVLLVHGLRGSTGVSYIAGMMQALAARGCRVSAVDCRGYGRSSLSQAGLFHALAWQDLEDIIAAMQLRHPGRPVVLVGFSLGAMVMINYLANADASIVKGAVSVCCPYDLQGVINHLDHDFCGRLYGRILLKSCLDQVYEGGIGRGGFEGRVPPLATIQDFAAFDRSITAPLHGFSDELDYYRQSAIDRDKLTKVSVPLLLVQDSEDPIVPAQVLAPPSWAEGNISILTTHGGGHVGYVGGVHKLQPDHWLEDEVIPRWLRYVDAR